MFQMISRPAVFSEEHEERLLGDFFSTDQIGYYADIGANSPENSTSRIFAEKGWNGIIVEPIPMNVSAFIASGRHNIYGYALTSPEKAKADKAIFHLAGKNGAHSSLERSNIDPTSNPENAITVKLTTLDKLLERAEAAKVDFLSIDTEGTEIDVLAGFNFSKYRPRLILVEDWGRSFKLHSFLNSKGYQRVRRTGFNSWYVPENDRSILISAYGRFQLFKKYVLGMPFKNFRLWRHKMVAKSMRS